MNKRTERKLLRIWDKLNRWQTVKIGYHIYGGIDNHRAFIGIMDTIEIAVGKKAINEYINNSK